MKSAGGGGAARYRGDSHTTLWLAYGLSDGRFGVRGALCLVLVPETSKSPKSVSVSRSPLVYRRSRDGKLPSRSFYIARVRSNNLIMEALPA